MVYAWFLAVNITMQLVKKNSIKDRQGFLQFSTFITGGPVDWVRVDADGLSELYFGFGVR